MFRPVRISAPATALLTLEEAKLHCRDEADVSDEDALITELIQAATDHFDGWSGVLGRCLISQTWRQDFSKWGDNLRLPFPDVQSVTVKYFDADNSEQTVASSAYELLEDATGSFVQFNSTFTIPTVYSDRASPVRITFVAGYGDAAADVPQTIIRAAAWLICHWYEHREAVGVSMSDIPMTVDDMVSPYRRICP